MAGSPPSDLEQKASRFLLIALIKFGAENRIDRASDHDRKILFKRNAFDSFYPQANCVGRSVRVSVCRGGPVAAGSITEVPVISDCRHAVGRASCRERNGLTSFGLLRQRDIH